METKRKKNHCETKAIHYNIVITSVDVYMWRSLHIYIYIYIYNMYNNNIIIYIIIILLYYCDIDNEVSWF